MKRTSIIAAVLFSSLFAIPAFAQPAGVPARGTGPAMVGQPGAGSQGQNGAARLRRIGFDQQTAQKVRQIHQKYRTERQSIKRQVQTHRQRIAQLLQANSNDQNEFQTAITGLRNARKQLQASKDREFAELQQVLTPRQQAQLMASAKKRSGKGKNPGARGPRRGGKGRSGRAGGRNAPPNR